MSQTYSFLDVHATIVGPGGAIPLGSGAGASEEGITLDAAEDINSMTIGADGSVMHSLHAGKSGTITIRLLKTSPVNAALMAMYNFQTAAATTHGQNTITITDAARGDVATARQVAFARRPSLAWGKDAGLNEWSFHAGIIDATLGV